MLLLRGNAAPRSGPRLHSPDFSLSLSLLYDALEVPGGGGGAPNVVYQP